MEKSLKLQEKQFFLMEKNRLKKKKIGKGTIKKWDKNSFKKIGENLLNI